MDKLHSTRLLNEAGDTAYSLLIVGLSLTGIAGVLYHVLAPEGMLSQWILGLWAHHPLFSTLVMIGVVAMALAARTGDLGVAAGRTASDFPLYLVVALGMLFAARLIVLGTL
jgi:hypothetical protein